MLHYQKAAEQLLATETIFPKCSPAVIHQKNPYLHLSKALVILMSKQLPAGWMGGYPTQTADIQREEPVIH